MYSVIKRVVARIRDISGKNKYFDGKQYWEARAGMYGKNAVLNIAHKETEFDQVPASQREILPPLFTNQLLGSERSVLDFGCGPGRFTPDLARAIHGSAVGIDISEKLIQFARPAPNVTFRAAASGEIPGNIAEFRCGVRLSCAGRDPRGSPTDDHASRSGSQTWKTTVSHREHGTKTRWSVLVLSNSELLSIIVPFDRFAADFCIYRCFRRDFNFCRAEDSA